MGSWWKPVVRPGDKLGIEVGLEDRNDDDGAEKEKHVLFPEDAGMQAELGKGEEMSADAPRDQRHGKKQTTNHVDSPEERRCVAEARIVVPVELRGREPDEE